MRKTGIATMAATAFCLSVIQAPVVFADSQPAPQVAPQIAPQITWVKAFDTDLPVGSATLSGQPASSKIATPNAAAPFVCTVVVSDPSFSSSSISGNGDQVCSGTGWPLQRVVITIQKYKTLGIWNNLAQEGSVYTDNNLAYRSLAVSCRTLGTQTYRIVNDAYVRSGAQVAHAQSENYLRVTC